MFRSTLTLRSGVFAVVFGLALQTLVAGCSATVNNPQSPGSDPTGDADGGAPPDPGSVDPGAGTPTPTPPLMSSLRICKGATPALASGSFATTLPAGAKGPQAMIYKTANITGAMPTNKWWSSAAWTAFSEDMFPHPLAVKATATGLQVGLPQLSAVANGVFGGFSPDLTIGSTASANFPDKRVDAFTDWTVSLLFGGTLRTTFGHGLPFVYAEYSAGAPQLTFAEVPKLFAGDAQSGALGVTIGGRPWAIFAPTGKSWSGVGTTTITASGGAYLSVAALPEATPQAFAAYRAYAFSFVTDARADWSYDEASARLHTTYHVTTSAKEGSASGTILALYPHHWKNSTATLLPYSYKSVRGVMKTLAGDSFSTDQTFHGVLPTWPWSHGTMSTADYGTLVRSSITPVHAVAEDTYWLGKELGRLAALAPIAEQAGEAATATSAWSKLGGSLADYLSAGAQEVSHLFYYDANWGTLIGYPASYGSDDTLNDHHFHYGYFIRGAAEMARHDSTFAAKWGPMVQLLIQEIADWDRTDPCFPYLRNFDVYAGHSWASGNGVFADGNNNESSSEGMNAWGSLILYGAATGQRTLRDLGIYLYVTESASIAQYWFDVDGENLPSGYNHNYASMIWGGKSVYETWFTADPQMVRGINMLPMTTTSTYLGFRPEKVTSMMAQLVTEFGSNQFTSWRDVLWQYQALADAPGALALYQPTYSEEEGESHAHTFAMMQTLATLGRVNTTVTADAALYGVWQSGNKTTHAAYNPGTTARTVHFSDGATLAVPPGQLASD